MLKVIALSMALAGTAAVSPCPPPAGSVPIADLASVTPQIEELNVLLGTPVPSLIPVLNGKGPFTVFAPVNDAVLGLPKGTQDLLTKVLQNTTLPDVLKYHVISGAIASCELNGSTVVKTLNGANITVTKDKKGGVTVEGAEVVQADLAASNGYIHVINKLLLPPGVSLPEYPIVNAAGRAGLTTLQEAVNIAGLSPTLENPQNSFTCFFPTNEAFANLPAFPSLKNNATLLAKVLSYHCAADFLPASQVIGMEKSGKKLVTLDANQTLSFNLTAAGNLTVIANQSKATVTKPNQWTMSGVYHVIDTVLVPPGI